MNFTRELFRTAPPNGRALVELAGDGRRRQWTFAQLRRATEALAGALHARGLRQGDVVLTLIGNRPEWAITMLACFRQGYVVLPCTEQLRPKDLALRLEVAQPRLIVADPRNAELLGDVDALYLPFPAAPAPPPAELRPDDPCLITFTSGTSGAPKAVVHGQRYLTGQWLQATH